MGCLPLLEIVAATALRRVAAPRQNTPDQLSLSETECEQAIVLMPLPILISGNDE